MENSNFADHHRNQELDLHPFHLHFPIDPGLVPVPVPVRLLATVRVMPPLLIAQHPQKGDPGRESTATLAPRASTTLMIPANVADVEKTANAPSAPNQNQNPDATAEGGTVRVRGKKRYLNWILVSRGKKKKNLRKNGWKSLPR